MRDKLLKELNAALDDSHNMLEAKLLKVTHTVDTSDRFTGEVTGLSVVCDLLGIEQIYPVYEDGIIQRFE